MILSAIRQLISNSTIFRFNYSILVVHVHVPLFVHGLGVPTKHKIKQQ